MFDIYKNQRARRRSSLGAMAASNIRARRASTASQVRRTSSVSSQQQPTTVESKEVEADDIDDGDIGFNMDNPMAAAASRKISAPAAKAKNPIAEEATTSTRNDSDAPAAKVPTEASAAAEPAAPAVKAGKSDSLIAVWSSEHSRYYFSRGKASEWVKPDNFILKAQVEIDDRLTAGADVVVKGKDTKIKIVRGQDVIVGGGDENKRMRHALWWGENAWVSTFDIVKVGKTAKMLRINRREDGMVAITFESAEKASEWRDMITVLLEIEGRI